MVIDRGSGTTLNPTLWGKLVTLASKYPKTTEAVISGSVATGYDISRGEASVEKTAMNYVMGGVNAGKTPMQQASIGIIYTGIESANNKNNSDRDIAANVFAEPIGVVGATLSDKALGRFGFGDLSKQILSVLAGEEIKDNVKNKVQNTEEKGE